MREIRRPALRALLLSLLAAACVSRAGPQIEPATVEIPAALSPLPVRWSAGFALIETRIEGRGPFRLLLDTGASVLTISPSVVRALGLPEGAVRRSRGVEVAGAAGTSADVSDSVRLHEVTAGPVTLREIDALLLDMSAFENLLDVPLDGLFPVSAFRDGLFVFDPARSQALAGAGALPEPDGTEIVPLLDRGLPTVTFDAGGESFEVLLDTGSLDFLSIPAGRSRGLALRSGPVETGRLQTLGGRVASRQARLAGPVTWGRHRIEDPVFTLDDGPRGAAGMELLRSFRVTFDLRHRRVRFERGSSRPITCPSVRGIGAGYEMRDGAWTVAYVLPGSPAAAAGIEPGVPVLAIDGMPVSGRLIRSGRTAAPRSGSTRLALGGASPREVDLPVVTLLE